MVNWKRLSALIALVAVSSGAVYAYLRAQEKKRLLVAKAIRPQLPVTPKRPWRWATEPEWVVHQVTREIASWSALARGEDPHGTRIEVHRTDDRPDGPGSYAVQLTSSGGSRRWNVQPRPHVWDPTAYVALARELLGVAATIGGEPAPRVDELLLSADTLSLRRADATLFAEMSRRPRDAHLHEQAALLWASHGLRDSDGNMGDVRPALNGLTAQLALASALRGDTAPSRHGEIAVVALDTLLLRQMDAMAALDRLPAEGIAGPWKTALQLRTTLDTRQLPSPAKLSRLEMIEAVRAIRYSQSCRAAVARARSWRLRPAADWVRSTLTGGCSEPESSELGRDFLELQAADAAVLIDGRPGDLAVVLSSAQAASAENTHQPERPASVIARNIRADAGLRRIIAGLQLSLRSLVRLGLPQQVKMLSLATESLRENLPQRALLDIAFEGGSRRDALDTREFELPQEICDRTARLIADRPDLVPEAWWGITVRCRKHNLLSMAKDQDWRAPVVAPGTGRLGTGPWQTGSAVTPASLEAASQRAPWVADIAARCLRAKYHSSPPPAAVLATYSRLLEYDIASMMGAVFYLHGDDDQIQLLSERICQSDAERCGHYASYLATLGRPESAERMWKRALASSRDLITLSNSLAGYVDLLLERGDTEEALRVARLAADVYSAEGLRTLGFAYERLGQFDKAATQYARITKRYDTIDDENQFYVRYRQRQADERFREEGRRAMAEIFPRGLQRKSVADFQRDGHRGGVSLGSGTLPEGLYRLGLRNNDFLVAVDGFAVESQRQMDAVLTFSDEPRITVIFLKQNKAFTEAAGPYPRTKYGLAIARQPQAVGGH